MGADAKRLPLPAPTESAIDGGSVVAASDLTTDISRRTDRTSYSIPEDGSPVVLSTKKIRTEKTGGPNSPSQTSLLIEYFEGSRSRDKTHSRPSVRVKVTPSAKKLKNLTNDSVKITEVGKDKKSSHSRHISLNHDNSDIRALDGTEISHSSESNLSARPPIEIEVLHNPSDLSSNASRFIPATSDISSMPADSMLEGHSTLSMPAVHRDTEEAQELERAQTDTLKAPAIKHSRSVSRERITQKVMEKLAQEKVVQDLSGRRKTQKTRPQSGSSNELNEENLKSRSRRSSASQRDDEFKSGTDSSLLRARDQDSNLSGTSKVSLNNPRLLQTVEDVVRRLILPEIETIKRQQSINEGKGRYDQDTRDSTTTQSSLSRTEIDRKLSKSSSAPHINPKVVLNRDKDNAGLSLADETPKHKKHRRSSKGSATETPLSRQESFDSVAREKERIHRNKETHSKTKDAFVDIGTAAAATVAATGAGLALTAAALKGHDSRVRAESRTQSRESGTRERRKKRSKSRSGTNSIAHTEEEYHLRDKIPPLPMQSEMVDSDLTRESILSAETATELERPHSKASKQSGTPVQEVARASPRTVMPYSRTSPRTPLATTSTPRNVRSRGELVLGSPRSDRSLSSKAMAASLAAGGLGGAAAGLYSQKRAKDTDEHAYQAGELDQSPTHKYSPASSQRRLGAKSERVGSRSADRTPSESSAGAQRSRLNEPSHDSLRSTSTTQYPLYQKRHQGINLEDEGEVLDHETSREQAFKGEQRSYSEFGHEPSNSYSEEGFRDSGDYDSLRDSRAFTDVDRLSGLQTHPRELEAQRNAFKSSEKYRSGVRETQRDSLDTDLSKATHSRDFSIDSTSFGQAETGQQVHDVGANPDFVHPPHGVESAVASLMEPSMIGSSFSDVNRYSDIPDSAGRNREFSEAQRNQTDDPAQLTQDASPSRQRWSAIKSHAKQLSDESNLKEMDSRSPHRFDQTNQPEEKLAFGSSGLPLAHDPLPEAEYVKSGDDHSDLTNSPLARKQPSILEEPMGDEHEHRGHWPYEPTPPHRQQAFVQDDDHDEHFTNRGNTALIGAAVGAAGLGIGAAAGLGATASSAAKPIQYQDHPMRKRSSQSSASIDDYGRVIQSHQNLQHESHGDTPGNLKDEGYVSAAQPRSVGAITPLSFSKPPPLLFDNEDLNKDIDVGVGKDDPFLSARHTRHLSTNSHGMASPLYDSATGKGVDHIQSKDVVALMDHLTVRDGQRNARDTEILVHLVRSAAEMRNSFEDMKKFVKEQNRINMHRTDVDAEKTVNKILSNSRNLDAGMSRTNQSTNSEDVVTKKKNIFQRALKGLSSRSTNDLSRMEDMLEQLLDEVEELKMAQYNPSPAMLNTVLNQQRSLASHERLRSGIDSGYEPEGQAGTSSTPNHSGNLTMTPPRQSQRMHSGYDPRRESENRVSTVHEDDEDHYEDEYNEGMLTPTQEVQHQRRISFETPSKELAAKRTASSENTPITSKQSDKSRKHKSTGSGIFGIPKISRWSKTTTSSTPAKDGSYSDASRSGSSIDVVRNRHDSPVDEDRLRSTTSLTRGDQISRSPSPLIPEDASQVSFEDAKYKANRHSLTLEHPQPRQGPTHRHRTHLESKAYEFRSASGGARDAGQTMSPDSDTFGSVPSLARLPGNGFGNQRVNAVRTNNGNTSSPLSRSVTYDGHISDNQLTSNNEQEYAPARPPKIRDDGPLVPPKIPLEQSHSPEMRDYDDYTDSNDDVSDHDHSHDNEEGEADTHDEAWRYSQGGPQDAEPIARRVSPYSPGGLLAPIEERYSLEQARSTRTASPVYDEYDEDTENRAATPRQDPRPAIGATAAGRSPGEARQITPLGPRAMPGVGNNAPKGTVKRRPVPGTL